ncbi:MAG: glycoside hydrolase family 1 protein [Christensenellales bacterium]|jgi:beta-glucosidase
MSLPHGFLWGAATSAVQIEGAWDADGKCPSIWDEASRRIRGGESPKRACDHYYRYEEDVNLMAQIGLNSYRFSVSWCRVMPEKGKINEKGLRFYRNLVRELLARGIEPVVTLYHWDLPVWIEKEGGWKNPKIVSLFAQYVRAVVDALSGSVRYWITLNEPQMFLMRGYMVGTQAPFRFSPFSFRKLLRNMLLAHGEAVSVIRKRALLPPKIGLAVASATYIPDGESAKHVDRAHKYSFEGPIGEIGNGIYTDPILLGKPSFLMRGALSEADLQIISQKIDFIGLNVYQPNNAYYPHQARYWFKPRNMLGWVMDSRCMYWTIRHYHERYRIPVFITENGMPCEDALSEDGFVHDRQRIRALNDHIQSMFRAISEGIPVIGYQHWSLLDNLEWRYGYKPRFGLIHVDFDTLKRTIKDSGFRYAELIRAHSV